MCCEQQEMKTKSTVPRGTLGTAQQVVHFVLLCGFHTVEAVVIITARGNTSGRARVKFEVIAKQYGMSHFVLRHTE